MTAPLAHAQAAQPYGAFAYSPSDHSVVGDGFGSTAVDAESAAILNCGSADCIPVAWFEHAYGQFDVSSNGAWGWGYAPTAQGAAYYAQHYCGSTCTAVIPAVAASPSAASTGSDLTGRACMILAPNGANEGPFGVYGHVGWAFLSDRDSGTWIFGANEGPSIGITGPSKTWIARGSWSTLVTDFTSAVDYHAAGYYEFFRCSSFAANNATEAYNTALSLQNKIYVGPPLPYDNDCLTNAVDILNVYGASLDASDSYPGGHWGPKDYFDNELTGWEQQVAWA